MLLAYVVVFVLSTFHVKALEYPVVQVDQGALQGVEDQTTLGKKIYKFVGVPYAKPPVGKNRFEEPKPAEKWQGIYPATQHSSVCLQHMLNYDSPDLITGEEDCLYLNIYIPALSNSSNLPVVVYFHGGAFMYGTGHIFTPHFILDRFDFVYVSVNYRLGPFGFLSTEDEIVPGNNGLKDQALALKWVNQNIAAFGGNKDDVTVSGLSAGGASVHLHYLSPQTTGLFQKGISMSGCALNPWVLAEKSAEKAKQLALSVGCPIDTSKQMINCLKRRPGRKILAQLKSLFWPWGTLPFSPFGVVVETSGKNPYLSEHPLKLISEGKVADLPWLTSITKDEGLYPAARFIDREELLNELNDNWNQIVPHILDFNFTIPSADINSVSDKIRQFYFKGDQVSIQNRNKLVELIGDRLFNVDMEKASRLQAEVNQSPVYFYEFAYQGKYSISIFISKLNVTYGVSHGDDLIYILNRPILTPLEIQEDKEVMMKMTEIWASFIQSGKPSIGEDVVWEPVLRNSGNFKYLLINSSKDIRSQSAAQLGNREFWDSINFDELESFLQNTYTKDEL
ncbi:venom carboxylesterase-6-like [Macrosteles quadrilineatus]|uniref:venom carboxylesterase-6-like n=1 Tax=Macrosteles quadrilineatus TaxID=74068 RepID=UPI0023E17C82|nr:venom carboxylesterase-6-like [Macrosteles quadrilineatus]